MIRVYEVDGGFRWCLIDITGRHIYYGDTTVYPSDFVAADAANSWRNEFWRRCKDRERFPGSY